jgi:hypothetical protein
MKLPNLSNEEKLESWKLSVKKKFPSVASRIKFKVKSESIHDKPKIYAEVDGKDRCYGIFDMKTETGEVLESIDILQDYLNDDDILSFLESKKYFENDPDERYKRILALLKQSNPLMYRKINNMD